MPRGRKYAPPPTPNYRHAPIPMRLVSGYGQVERRGDFYWQVSDSGQRRVALAIPHGTDPGDDWSIVILPVCTGKKDERQWLWDGCADRPTLKPSIHTHGAWHGFVTDGEMVEA